MNGWHNINERGVRGWFTHLPRARDFHRSSGYELKNQKKKVFNFLNNIHDKKFDMNKWLN